MRTSVRICGVDYPNCEIVRDGEYCGLKTPDKTLWVFPVCDDDGQEVKALPPFLPVEIRPVTNQLPDLTQQYPETVRQTFETRRSFFERTTTFDLYLRDYPSDSTTTEEQFAEARSQILAESLDEFSRSSRARLAVWNEHGSFQIADKIGYLGDVWEAEKSRNGSERRVSRHMSPAMSLAIRLGKGSLTDKRAWDIINRLKYVMIYDTESGRKWIYLEAIQEAASKQPYTPVVRVELVWPQWKAILRAFFQSLTDLIRAQEVSSKSQTWHSSDWRVIYLPPQNGQESARLPLNTEFRALCILLDKTDGKTLPFSALSNQIGVLAKQLDEEDHAESPALNSPRRMDELLDTKMGKRLIALGILRVLEILGREKALGLFPPKN